jgi:hypothetical protein
MYPVTEVKTNPNAAPELAILNGGAAAVTAPSFSFPIGYHITTCTPTSVSIFN